MTNDPFANSVSRSRMDHGIRIGGLRLRPSFTGPEKIWIEKPDGEGGDFDTVEVEKLLRQFYDANF